MILHEALVFETNYNCPSPVIIIITAISQKFIFESEAA